MEEHKFQCNTAVFWSQKALKSSFRKFGKGIVVWSKDSARGVPAIVQVLGDVGGIQQLQKVTELSLRSQKLSDAVRR